MKGFEIKQDKGNENRFVARNVKVLELRIWAINDKWFTGTIETKKGNCLFLLAAYGTPEQCVAVANLYIESKAAYIAEALEAEKA